MTGAKGIGDAIGLAAPWAGSFPRLAIALSDYIIRQTRQVSGLDYSLIDYRGVASAATRLNLEWWSDHQRAFAALMDLWWSNLALIATDVPGAAPVEQDAVRDKRFQDKAWGEDPLRLLRDLYLHNSSWLLAQVRAARTLDSHDRHKLEFYTRQLVSALSPSNWPNSESARSRTHARDLWGEPAPGSP